jgi:hypothetical protein
MNARRWLIQLLSGLAAIAAEPAFSHCVDDKSGSSCNFTGTVVDSCCHYVNATDACWWSNYGRQLSQTRRMSWCSNNGSPNWAWTNTTGSWSDCCTTVTAWC